MAESTEDLREQVARLLADNDPEYPECDWHSWDDTAHKWYRAMADSLLPLFAARERAAAEKAIQAVIDNAGYDESTGLADGVSGWVDAERRTAYELAIYESIDAIRAQLEGDGA